MCFCDEVQEFMSSVPDYSLNLAWGYISTCSKIVNDCPEKDFLYVNGDAFDTNERSGYATYVGNDSDYPSLK